jgi:hypothetical protein
MRAKTKQKFVCAKNWIRNYQIFMELSVTNKNFIPKLNGLRKIFGLSKLKEFTQTTVVLGSNPSDKDWADFAHLHKQIVACRKQFLSERGDDVQKLLFEMIDIILEEIKFGQEWKLPLIDVLLTGYITPPLHNLVIKIDEKTKKVNLEINQNTTLKDIGELWGTIQEKIVAIDGIKLKKRYLKHGFNKHLKLLSKEEAIRSEDKKIKGLTLIGRITPNSSKNEGLPTVEQDKKALARLRQIKHRLKRV